jgi:hypothetical protein
LETTTEEQLVTATPQELTGAVSGAFRIGGLVSNNNGTISNCYSTVNVTVSVQEVGGLVEYNNGLAQATPQEL